MLPRREFREESLVEYAEFPSVARPIYRTNRGQLIRQVTSCSASAEYDDCNGNQSYYDETSNSAWSSNDTSVATVDTGVTNFFVGDDPTAYEREFS